MYKKATFFVHILHKKGVFIVCLKKPLITSLLIGGLISSVSVPVFAENNTSTIKTVTHSQTEGSLDVNSSDQNTVVSDVLTVNQVVERRADEQGISETQAARSIISNTQNPMVKNSSNAITKGLVDTTSTAQTVAATSATYRTINTRFTVTSTYKPSLNFYCQTNEGGTSFRAIKKILNVSMNRAHLGTGRSKQFGGDVYTKLEDANRIYWIVNGDFFDNGSTTGGGSVNLGIDKAVSLEFNASHTSNHYKYIYKTGYTRF